jgi:hypothetical protein
MKFSKVFSKTFIIITLAVIILLGGIIAAIKYPFLTKVPFYKNIFSSLEDNKYNAAPYDNDPAGCQKHGGTYHDRPKYTDLDSNPNADPYCVIPLPDGQGPCLIDEECDGDYCFYEKAGSELGSCSSNVDYGDKTYATCHKPFENLFFANGKTTCDN